MDKDLSVICDLEISKYTKLGQLLASAVEATSPKEVALIFKYLSSLHPEAIFTMSKNEKFL